jgi:hypothetical protein
MLNVYQGSTLRYMTLQLFTLLFLQTQYLDTQKKKVQST